MQSARYSCFNAFFFLLFVHTLPNVVLAGSAQVDIACNAKEDGAVLKGYVPGDSLDMKLAFQLKDQRFLYSNEYEAPAESIKADIQVKDALFKKARAQKRYEFDVIDPKDKKVVHLSLRAQRKTIKSWRTSSGEDKGTFRAEVSVKGKDGVELYRGVMACSYYYSI